MHQLRLIKFVNFRRSCNFSFAIPGMGISSLRRSARADPSQSIVDSPFMDAVPENRDGRIANFILSQFRRSIVAKWAYRFYYYHIAETTRPAAKCQTICGDRKQILSGIGPSDRVKDDKIQLRHESVLPSGPRSLMDTDIIISRASRVYDWFVFLEEELSRRTKRRRRLTFVGYFLTSMRRMIGARVIAFRLIDSTTFHRASASWPPGWKLTAQSARESEVTKATAVLNTFVLCMHHRSK